MRVKPKPQVRAAAEATFSGLRTKSIIRNLESDAENERNFRSALQPWQVWSNLERCWSNITPSVFGCTSYAQISYTLRTKHVLIFSDQKLERFLAMECISIRTGYTSFSLEISRFPIFCPNYHVKRIDKSSMTLICIFQSTSNTDSS